jgi:hypothetical protein
VRPHLHTVAGTSAYGDAAYFLSIQLPGALALARKCYNRKYIIVIKPLFFLKIRDAAPDLRGGESSDVRGID